MLLSILNLSYAKTIFLNKGTFVTGKSESISGANDKIRSP